MLIYFLTFCLVVGTVVVTYCMVSIVFDFFRALHRRADRMSIYNIMGLYNQDFERCTSKREAEVVARSEQLFFRKRWRE